MNAPRRLDFNVAALVKPAVSPDEPRDTYIFFYSDDHAADVLKVFGRFASNPELSFTWYDAAMLSQRVRRAMREAQQEQQP